MNQPTKPSAGALRAARNLRGRKWLARSRSDDEETAQVIDRETGLAELLEAAKLALAELDHSAENAEIVSPPIFDLHAVERKVLGQAIARVESND